MVAEEEAEGMSYLDLLTAHPSETGSDQAAAPQADPEKPTKATQKQVGCVPLHASPLASYVLALIASQIEEL